MMRGKKDVGTSLSASVLDVLFNRKNNGNIVNRIKLLV